MYLFKRFIFFSCNFTDLEIKVFLSMNNIDETEDITDEDVERVITQIRRAKHEEIEGDEGGEPNITPDMFMRFVYLYRLSEIIVICVSRA